MAHKEHAENKGKCYKQKRFAANKKDRCTAQKKGAEAIKKQTL